MWSCKLNIARLWGHSWPMCGALYGAGFILQCSLILCHALYHQMEKKFYYHKCLVYSQNILKHNILDLGRNLEIIWFSSLMLQRRRMLPEKQCTGIPPYYTLLDSASQILNFINWSLVTSLLAQFFNTAHFIVSVSHFCNSHNISNFSIIFL